MQLLNYLFSFIQLFAVSDKYSHPDFENPPVSTIIAAGDDAMPYLEFTKKTFPEARWKVNLIIQEIRKPKIKKLIDDLGNKDFKVRQNAHDQLVKHGWYARVELLNTIGSNIFNSPSMDPEVLDRCKKIIEEIDGNGNWDDPDPPEDAPLPDVKQFDEDEAGMKRLRKLFGS